MKLTETPSSGHRCSTFSLSELRVDEERRRDTPSKSRQQASTQDDIDDRGDENQDTYRAAKCSHRHCNYNAGALSERYLTTGSPHRPPVDVSQRQAASGTVAADDELLHVLVTKPEIAGKPRDNIVFEGDMDLRTTFETSYEALARMRLDHWKRYQEATKSAGNERQPHNRCGSGAQHPAPGQRSRTDVALLDDGPPEEGGPRGSASNAVQRQLDVSVESSKQCKRALDASSRGRQQQRQHHQLAGTDTSRPAPAPDSENNKSVADKRQRQPPVLANKSERQKISCKHGPPEEWPAPGPAQRSNSKQRAATGGLTLRRRDNDHGQLARANTNQQQQQNALIDPDLSPIIVYDANMNRLEKVGLRKRSKYRPSTSLKPGARGLFGDQKEEPARVLAPANTVHDKQQATGN